MDRTIDLRENCTCRVVSISVIYLVLVSTKRITKPCISPEEKKGIESCLKLTSKKPLTLSLLADYIFEL